jgi:hypothetical protein
MLQCRHVLREAHCGETDDVRTLKDSAIPLLVVPAARFSRLFRTKDCAWRFAAFEEGWVGGHGVKVLAKWQP